MLNTPIKPLLLHPSSTPPVGDGWLHQVKFDGFRCTLHFVKGQGVKLWTRHLTPCERQFPEMQGITLNATNAVLDGEMICLDEQNKPCWESVISRFNTSKEASITRLSKTSPCIFMAFDVLYVDGQDITGKKLIERLEYLDQLIVSSNHISVVDSHSDGEGLFQATKDLQLEGIVSKRKNSTYTCNARPENTWVKVKNYTFDVVEIAGIRKDSFGWLLTKDHGKTYAGVCEFVTPTERQAFSRIAKQLIKREDKNYIYLDPLVRCKVRFQGYTKKGQLMRTPSFVEFVLN